MYFSKRRKGAREKYESFVADGVESGKQEELVGGGLRGFLKEAGGAVITAYDDRILGSGDFVEQLRQENERLKELVADLSLANMTLKKSRY